MLSTVNDMFVGPLWFDRSTTAGSGYCAAKQPLPINGPGDGSTVMPITVPIGTILLLTPERKFIVAPKNAKGEDPDNYKPALEVNAAYVDGFMFAQYIGTVGNGITFYQEAKGSVDSIIQKHWKLAVGKWRFSDVFNKDNLKYAIENSLPGGSRPATPIMYTKVDSGAVAPAVKNTSNVCSVVIDTASKFSSIKDGVYKLEILYKNVRDLSPNQFSRPYVYVGPAGGTPSNVEVCVGLYKMVNADKFAKITASLDKDQKKLTLTAIDPIYDLNQRYEFAPIDFDASLSVSQGDIMNYNEASSDATVTKTAASVAPGDWRYVSDAEKRQVAHQGITNWVHFPVQLPKMFTQEGRLYDVISFDYANPYNAADNTIGRKSRQAFQLFVDLGTSDIGTNRAATDSGVALKNTLESLSFIFTGNSITAFTRNILKSTESEEQEQEGVKRLRK